MDGDSEVVKYFHVALATNKKLIIVPFKRDQAKEIGWRMYLQSKVSEGVVSFEEFDDLD